MMTRKGYVAAYMEVNEFRREKRKHNVGTWYDKEGITWKIEWVDAMINSMTFEQLNELEIEVKEKRNARWRQNKIASQNR